MACYHIQLTLNKYSCLFFLPLHLLSVASRKSRASWEGTIIKCFNYRIVIREPAVFLKPMALLLISIYSRVTPTCLPAQCLNVINCHNKAKYILRSLHGSWTPPQLDRLLISFIGYRRQKSALLSLWLDSLDTPSPPPPQPISPIMPFQTQNALANHKLMLNLPSFLREKWSSLESQLDSAKWTLCFCSKLYHGQLNNPMWV